jgi:hypothetical protein
MLKFATLKFATLNFAVVRRHHAILAHNVIA